MDDIKALEKSIGDGRVIMVVNRLPLNFVYDDAGQIKSLERTGRSPLESSIRRLKEMGKEVITVGRCIEDRIAQTSKEDLRAKLRESDCEPVFVSEELATGHFDGFCKTVLWPLFHYDLRQSTKIFDPALFEAYKNFNLRYADVIQNIYRPGDIIWVHDYHFLMLPEQLRQCLPEKVKIGFFLHIIFPSSELFKTLPVRRDLLRGVVAADLIGFQTYAYARHFISATSLLLGLDCSPNSILVVEPYPHKISIGVFPMGIDCDAFVELLNEADTVKEMAALKERFGNKKLVIGRDRLDPIKAIPQKLNIFEKFIEEYPEVGANTVLLQFVTPPHNCQVASFSDELAVIYGLVGRINGKHSTVDHTPVHLLYNEPSANEVAALYACADAALITPVRDGMNVTSHEFVVCQRDKHAPLILSEFAGSAQTLAGAIFVNPWDMEEGARALNAALTMSSEEKDLKWQYNHSILTRYSAFHWLRNFLAELINPATLLGGEPQQVPVLNVDEVVEAFKKAEKRTLLLDYDGTLAPIVSSPEDAFPPQKTLDALEVLSRDPNTEICVISGRDRPSLVSFLGHLDVGMSCEHGLYYRAGPDQEWAPTFFDLDLSWHDIIRPLFDAFSASTPGSFTELKTVTMTWHHRKCDPDYGQWKEQELLVQLKNLASKLPIEILHGKKAVEIRPTGFHKGYVVQQILNTRPTNFVLCAGDDRTDEDMFRAIDPARVDYAATVRIGAHATSAKAFLKRQKDMPDLLHRLALAAQGKEDEK